MDEPLGRRWFFHFFTHYHVPPRPELAVGSGGSLFADDDLPRRRESAAGHCACDAVHRAVGLVRVCDRRFVPALREEGKEVVALLASPKSRTSWDLRPGAFRKRSNVGHIRRVQAAFARMALRAAPR
jgi:hypothetical protein